MKYILSLLLISFTSLSYAADEELKSVEQLLKQAKLVFSDDFNRNEQDETQEQIGNHWLTNSEKRAQGRKQVDLDNGVLHITKLKGVKAAVNVNNKMSFKNGIVKLKFNMTHQQGAKFNFYDTNATEQSFSGHICQLKVEPKAFQIVDQIKGRFRRDILFKELTTEAQNEVTAKTTTTIPVKYELNKWYELTMVIIDDVFEVYIDDVKIGKLKSEGVAHNLKDTFAFSITHSVKIDDMQVWLLD
ncbi:hypothetical protein [Pseudocolwellia agarivorans]|uniref:hypothetical protein n=1 Tax=Pseudocolwellia agarivorans TaxID=1911682 RepID=UPI000986CE42|nr:hypothetical protein [Pseudocolwellia agarivorans]